MMAMTWLAWMPLLHAAPLITLDFTEDQGGMVSSNGLHWEWAEVTSGPDDFSGHAWVTQADGNYLNDASDHLGLPLLDLSSIDRPVLVLEHWYEIDQSADGDLGWIEALMGGEYVRIYPFTGYPSALGFSGSSGSFVTDYFDLSGVDDASSIRLRFETDETVTRAGWVLRHLSIDDGDPSPPIIRGATELQDTQDLTGPYVVHAKITDDLATPEATIWWSIGGGLEGSAPMTAVGSDLYRGDIPAASPGLEITWGIRATDGTNTATWPHDDKATFDVFLAAPTSLIAPEARTDGRVEGLDVLLQWDAPDSPHPLVHTLLLRDGEPIGTTEASSALVPLTQREHTVSVAGIFNTPGGLYMGDEATPIPLTVALPLASELEPAQGFQGDTLRVEVQGVNLLLADGQTAILFADGIQVDEIEIIDADNAQVTIHIDEDAATTHSEVMVLSGRTSIPIPQGFEVRSGDERPRITKIEPSGIEQGDQATLTITTNAALLSDPVVDLGEGVFVQDIRVDGTTLTVEVAAAPDAPVGPHGVAVDDGRRILDGAELQIRDARPAPSKVCGTIPGPRHGWWLVMLSCFLTTRRKEAQK